MCPSPSNRATRQLTSIDLPNPPRNKVGVLPAALHFRNLQASQVELRPLGDAGGDVPKVGEKQHPRAVVNRGVCYPISLENMAFPGRYSLSTGWVCVHLRRPGGSNTGPRLLLASFSSSKQASECQRGDQTRSKKRLMGKWPYETQLPQTNCASPAGHKLRVIESLLGSKNVRAQVILCQELP